MTKFKEIRLSRGYSTEELAEAAHVGESVVRMMDRGYVPSRYLYRESIARALDVDAVELWPSE